MDSKLTDPRGATRDNHIIHATVAAYAVPRKFRIMRRHDGTYFLLGSRGERIDTLAIGGNTAAGALRMMRRHIRLNRTMARALAPAPIIIRAKSARDFVAGFVGNQSNLEGK